MVIEEVPILAGKEFDVGSEGYEAASGLEAAEGFGERGLEELFVGQVLEEVAGEDDVEGGVFEGPGLAAVLLEELNFGFQPVSCSGIEVHGELLGSGDGVAELTVAASEVEDRVLRPDPL